MFARCMGALVATCFFFLSSAAPAQFVREEESDGFTYKSRVYPKNRGKTTKKNPLRKFALSKKCCGATKILKQQETSVKKILRL